MTNSGRGIAALRGCCADQMQAGGGTDAGMHESIPTGTAGRTLTEPPCQQGLVKLRGRPSPPAGIQKLGVWIKPIHFCFNLLNA